MTTPLARLAAYTAAARRHGVTLVDALPDAGVPPTRVELRVADIAAALAIHEEFCPDAEHCQACGAVLCATHGLGNAADCPADAVHCASPWCWDEACMAAHRDEIAADIAADHQLTQ